MRTNTHRLVCPLPPVHLLLLLLAQTTVLFFPLIMAAADTPPTTISPNYGGGFVPQTTPANIAEAGKLLAAAVSNSSQIDPNAYYIIHRMDYDVDAGALRDVGWYIYYSPWEHAQGFSFAWFDDPLIHGNYKRARIYGSNNLYLIPIMVMPSLDLSNADTATIKALEIQAAQAIADTASLLHSAITSPDSLRIFIEGLGHATLKPQEAKDPASVLPTYHLVNLSSYDFSRIDIPDGDALKSLSAADLKIGALPDPQLRSLKQLSAWIVRETLEGFSHGKREQISSISDIQWKTDGSAKPLPITFVSDSNGIYVPTQIIDTSKTPQDVIGKIATMLPNYKVTVTAREPQPASDFKAVLGLIGAQSAAAVTFKIDSGTSFKSVFAGKAWARTASNRLHVGALPVDMTIDAVKQNDASKTDTQDQTVKNTGGTDGHTAPDPPDPPQTDTAKKNTPPAGGSTKQGTDTQASNALSSIKIQNEKKYYYDIGVGIPLKSFDEVQYDSTNSIITAKTIQKQNVFAFFEFHPYPTDLASNRLRLVPTLMAGLPLAGQPLHQQIYAANLGLWKVEPFIGILVHRDMVPAGNAANNTTPSVTGTAASLTPRWGARLTFGINVPVSAVKSAFSSKSKSTNTASKPTSNTGSKQ